MGFVSETRRALLGSQHDLECLKGEGQNGETKVYSIWPKKLPQGVADRINALQVSVLARPGAVKKVKALAKAKSDDRELTDEEIESSVEIMQSMPDGMSTEIARLSIEHGIGRHNFDDDNGKLIGEGRSLTPEVVDMILDSWPLAQEITKVVTEFNRPLAKKSKGNSSS